MRSMFKKDGVPIALKLPVIALFWGIIIWGLVTGNWGWAAIAFIATGVAFGVLLQVLYPAAMSESSSPIRLNTSPVSNSTTIAKPASAVWKTLTRVEKWREWWTSGITSVSPGWSKGATLKWDEGGTSKVSICRPQREMRIESRSIEMRISLFQQGGSTLVELEEIPINGARWTDGGFSRLVPLAEALEKLKVCVEAHDAGRMS